MAEKKSLNSTLARYFNMARRIVGPDYTDSQAMSRVFDLARGMVNPRAKKAKGGKITKRK